MQCVGCNVYRYGEQYKFSIQLDIKYGGGTAEEMLVKSRETCKIMDIELLEKINYYESLVKDLI